MTTAPLISDLITQEINSQKWLKHVFQVIRANGVYFVLVTMFISVNPREKWKLSLIQAIFIIIYWTVLGSIENLTKSNF